jgi:Spy/CpxP family protein refolding chaperone
MVTAATKPRAAREFELPMGHFQRGDVMRRYGKILWSAGIVVTLIAFGVFAAPAQNAKAVRQRLAQSPDLQMRVQDFIAGLNLSAQQKEQAKSILAAHKEEIQNVVRENRQARQELAVGLNQGADLQTLKAAHDKMSQASWDQLLLRNKISSEIRSILTPEQQQKLQNRRQQRLQNRQQLGKKAGNGTGN